MLSWSHHLVRSTRRSSRRISTLHSRSEYVAVIKTRCGHVYVYRNFIMIVLSSPTRGKLYAQPLRESLSLDARALSTISCALRSVYSASSSYLRAVLAHLLGDHEDISTRKREEEWERNGKQSETFKCRIYRFLSRPGPL